MDTAEQSLLLLLWKFVWNCLWVVSSYEWGVARQPDTLQIPFTALITSVPSVYTIATHSFESLCLDNIRACVYPELGTALPLTARIEGEVWISILMSVIGHWLLSGLTIMITTHNTNQTHVEFCPTYPPVISIDFLALPTWNLTVLDLLSPLPEYDKCWKPLSQFPPRRI